MKFVNNQYKLQTGIAGIVIAIKWLGFRDWLHCSWVRHCLVDEREVYEVKTGN